VTKLTAAQKEEAKIIIKECLLRRLSRQETVNVMNERLKFREENQKIQLNDLDKYKKSLKRESLAWMKAMIGSRYAYFAQYRERMNEYLNYQKHYWKLYFNNEGNPPLQKAILDSLQDTSAAISQLYDILPEIAGETYGDITRGEKAVSELSEKEGSSNGEDQASRTSEPDESRRDSTTPTETSGTSKEDPPPPF
jgi:hypothetical protein